VALIWRHSAQIRPVKVAVEKVAGPLAAADFKTSPEGFGTVPDHRKWGEIEDCCNGLQKITEAYIALGIE
jgi:hypothetical protein